MSSVSTQPVPEGPASVSGAPNLPVGFTDTFVSRFVDTGDLRLHAVIGGNGPPLLFVHGWPETWYAWRLLMPSLAKDFTVVAVDQRGIGLSDKPEGGYDTGTLADDLVSLMDELGYERFAVVGHDTGFAISYAMAADHPDKVARVALAEIPGPPVGSHSPPVFVPSFVNDKLWHIPFNRVEKLPEQLIRGREDIYFGYEFAIQGGTLPDDLIEYYVGLLSQPGRPHWQPRVLPRTRHHPRAERGAGEAAAHDAGPGHRGSRKPRRARGAGDGASRRQRRERRDPRRRPLGRRRSSRRNAGRTRHVPHAVPQRGAGRTHAGHRNDRLAAVPQGPPMPPLGGAVGWLNSEPLPVEVAATPRTDVAGAAQAEGKDALIGSPHDDVPGG